MNSVGEAYLEEVFREFGRLRTLAEKAVTQLPNDELFFVAPFSGGNPLAVQFKHMGGNLRSRWTDFFDSDGEKPDRHRDREFAVTADETRASVMLLWNRGWEALEQTITTMRGSDLDRSIKIRGESMSALAALNRALSHAAYHCGQIVLVSRSLSGSDWKWLSIPPGKSAEFNASLHDKNR